MIAAPSFTNTEAICPSMWFVGMSGISHRYESVLAKFTPTQSAGSRPGPWVTAIASIAGRSRGTMCCSNCSNNPASWLNIVRMFSSLSLSKGRKDVRTSFELHPDILTSLAPSKHSRKRGTMFFTCSLFAKAGNTPPNGACSLT